MNDLDMLTRLCEEVPLRPVSARTERLFLAGLEDAAGGAAGGRGGGAVRRALAGASAFRRAHPAWRPAAAAGLAAALAAGALTAVAVTSGPAARAPQVVTVADLANLAAAAAARQPAVRPGQWVYRQTELSGFHAPFLTWATADDQTEAALTQDTHGKVVVCRCELLWVHSSHPRLLPAKLRKHSPAIFHVLSYQELLSAPSTPRALLAAIHRGELRWHQVPAHPGRGWTALSIAQEPFQDIADMLSNYVPPPAVTANLYRALAFIPGVRVVRNAVDAAGQHGIGLLLPGHQLPRYRMATEIILNPRSHQIMGSQTEWWPPRRTGKPQWFNRSALLSQALVSGPGVRP
jgi:hypothetical protein